MKTRQHRVPERVVQSQIVATLRTIGAAVYVLGTKRRKGDYQGTMQTPGISDLVVFLPPRTRQRWVLLFVEAKAHGGRLSPEQKVFRDLCVNADVAHVAGNLDAVIGWLMANDYLKANQIPHYRLPAEMRL